MLKRILSSLVGLPVLVIFVFWRGGLPFVLGIAAFCLLGLAEFYRACHKHGERPLPWAGFAASSFFLLNAHAEARRWMNGRMNAVLTALVLTALIAELPREQRAPIRDLGSTLLGAVYVGWLFSYLILLRDQGAALLARVGGHLKLSLPASLSDPGAWVVLLVFAATWACDSGAFFIGRTWGRRKLAPDISPGKTVEGAAGGWLCAIGMALLFGALLGLSPAIALVIGTLVGLLAQVGDLCESALKRELGIKDFSGLLPGHGGVLDRFDSLLFTAPVVYHVLALWPQ